MQNEKKNMPASGTQNNVAFIQAALATATVLQNTVMPGPSVQNQNGGLDAHAELQQAYFGYREQVVNPMPDYPVLHVPESEYDKYLKDLPNEYPIRDEQSDQVIMASVSELMEETAARLNAGAAGDQGTSTRVPKRTFSAVEYDDDFVEPHPKSRSENNKTSRRTPTSSVRQEGEGKMAITEETPSTSSSSKVAPIALPPNAADAPMLRAALHTTPGSRTGRKNAKTSESKTTQSVRRRGVSNRRSVRPKKATAVKGADITVEQPSCSSAGISPRMKNNGTEQVAVQRTRDSDSESEFEIFSQSEDRSLFKEMSKRYRRIVKQYEVHRDSFQAAETTLQAAEQNLRGVDADLRRNEEERQRLLERRGRLEESVSNCQRIIDERRGDMETAKKKVDAIKKIIQD